MTSGAPFALTVKAATARILVGEGEGTAGTGLLLMDGVIATCAHVVRAALGLGDRGTPGAAAHVRLRLPYATGHDAASPAIAAVVLAAGWHPDRDLALLRLEGSGHPKAGFFACRVLQDDDSFPVDIFGFGGSAAPEGTTAEARIPRNALQGAYADMRRRDDASALFLEPGFSGAAVTDEAGKVVGLVRAQREQQGRHVARLILVGQVLEALAAALPQRPPDVALPTDDEIAFLVGAAEAGVASLKRSTNLARLPGAVRLHLTGLAQTLPDPARLADAAEHLRGIEDCWRELKARGSTGHFSLLDLGGVQSILQSMLPKLTAAAAGSGVAVPNDWDEAPDLPHAAEVRDLLAHIAERLAVLEEARNLPEVVRQPARTVLIRLQRILYGDPLHLAAVDRVRAELERLERDVFAELIRACQLLLGRHAARLSDLAIFRDSLADGSDGPEMVVLPSGTFMMGSPPDETEHDEDEGLHPVVIGYRFAMARYAVTFAAYDRFCDATKRDPSDDEGWGRGNRPVIDVDLHGAVDFCDWLSEQAGASYRLPSEAEWEYACRAGSATAFEPNVAATHHGRTILTAEANFHGGLTYGEGPRGENRGRTVPVDDPAFQPNAFGLSQMHGNVFEWCADHYVPDYGQAPADGAAFVDPLGVSNAGRVVRGGSWDDQPGGCRAANRGRGGPGYRNDLLGFRPARTL